LFSLSEYEHDNPAVGNKIDVIGEKVDESWRQQQGICSFVLVSQIPNTGVLVQKGEAFLEWLSPLRPWVKHNAVRENRAPRTSTSLLDEFLKWRSDPSGGFMLCAHGHPGAGKTVATYVEWSQSRFQLTCLDLFLLMG